MKQPFSFGKGNSEDYAPMINGHDHSKYITPSQAHDMTIARIQYYHDYLFAQADQIFDEQDDTSMQKLLERLICVHYEIFQDFIYYEGFTDED